MELIILLLIAIFFVLVCIVILIYFGFCLWVYSSFINLSRADQINESAMQGVSIIIPCRNEEKNIAQCIEAIIHQNNIHFPVEVLVVNDHSEDGSLAAVQAFHHPLDLKVIESMGIGKKAAIETGITASKYPIVYTIDADCFMSDQCLPTMYTMYANNNLNMLCGLVSYKNNGNLFSMMQQAESVALVGISAFMLNSGRPATCNGANLMFSKALFEHLGGYGSDKQLSSGDDDLLMQSFAAYQPDKVKFATNPACVVYTKTEKSFKNFIQQRIRWAGKRRAYKFSYNNYLMLLLLLKQVVFLSALFFGIFFNSPFLCLVCLIIFMSDVLLVLRFKSFLPVNWVAVILMPFYQMYIPLIPVFSKLMKNTWKGRDVVKA